jgi:hypothetical protein
VIARYIPAPKPAPPTKARDRGKPLVRVKYVPDRLAYLITEGPEQSELRWVHNGNTFIISNENIEKM